MRVRAQTPRATPRSENAVAFWCRRPKSAASPTEGGPGCRVMSTAYTGPAQALAQAMLNASGPISPHPGQVSGNRYCPATRWNGSTRERSVRTTRNDCAGLPRAVGPTAVVRPVGVCMAQPKNTDQQTDWMAVIGRSLAFHCLSEADLRDKDLASQADLLQALGLSRADAAKLLGTSADSLRVLQSRARTSRSKPGGKK